MLDNFAPEVPTARIERKPVELVGFVPEASFSPAPSVNVRPAKDSGLVTSPRTLVQAGFVCAVLTLAAVSVPGRAAQPAAPPVPVVQHTRVFVAATPVAFSIAPPRRNQDRQRAAAVSKPAPKRGLDPKPAARTSRPTASTEPLIVARALERTAGRTPTRQPRDAATVASTASLPLGSRTIVTTPTPTTTAVTGTAVASPAVAASALASTHAATVVAPSVSDEALVRSMLERYRGAYERLDASAALQVWPSLDERRLARAFSTLKSQTLDFDDCRIDVGGARGVAYCRGRTTYVGRVGKREPETQNRRWTFQIQKMGDSWAIDSVRSE